MEILLTKLQSLQIYSSNNERINYKSDEYSRDNWGRRWLHVVAMDSLEYREPETQYQMRFIDRELRKAFACFYTREDNDTNSQYPIATGHWGVGLSNSDRELKSKHIFTYIFTQISVSYAVVFIFRYDTIVKCIRTGKIIDLLLSRSSFQEKFPESIQKFESSRCYRWRFVQIPNQIFTSKTRCNSISNDE